MSDRIDKLFISGKLVDIMDIKSGVDLVHIPRFAKFLKNHEAVKKVFHASEMKRDSVEHLAGVFAIKEAFFKALGKNPHFLEIEVCPSRGKPTITYPTHHNISSIDISVSHDKDYAIAQVVMLVKK